MEPQPLHERLDRISTHWTLVFEAHCIEESRARPARAELIRRYLAAVYRYLLAMVRDPDLAEELGQQFAVVFLEGRFHRADPERGRFRDYVKAAAINLVRQHHKSRTTQPGPLPDDVGDMVTGRPQEPDEHAEFVRQWREEVMHQTWNALRQARPVCHDVLRLRVSDPELTSREIADRYSAEHTKPMNPANVRKTLQRAQSKFADLLVREVAGLLEQPDEQQLLAELEELDLLKYCRTALERWSAAS